MSAAAWDECECPRAPGAMWAERADALRERLTLAEALTVPLSESWRRDEVLQCTRDAKEPVAACVAVVVLAVVVAVVVAELLLVLLVVLVLGKEEKEAGREADSETEDVARLVAAMEVEVAAVEAAEEAETEEEGCGGPRGCW